jgi:hypothetical protein
MEAIAKSTAWGVVDGETRQRVSFNRDIHPIMADTCWHCHGPGRQEAGVRFDVRENAVSESESGLVPIRPSDPTESEAIRRIFSEDVSERMPRPDWRRASIIPQDRSCRFRRSHCDRPRHLESPRSNHPKLKQKRTMDDHLQQLNRRAFLTRAAHGIGAVALNQLFQETSSGSGLANAADSIRGGLHRLAKAKRVIFLTQAGGPSHLETFDYKPVLARLDSQPMPESFTVGQQLAQLQGKQLVCFGPRFKFRRFGQSGIDICELFPEIGSVADELCIVRSMWTEQINHDLAHMFLNSGARTAGFPSMGAWIVYGLGSESNDLPGFIVLMSNGKGGQMQPIAARQWSSGFLPGKYQGLKFNSVGSQVLHLNRPQGTTEARQRSTVEPVNYLNREAYATSQDAEALTRISQYEMAFRMQTCVPELVDLRDEPQHILNMYGCAPGDGSFASNCLLARRLAERGVRFIQLYHRDWDHHSDVASNVALKAAEVDRATAALIKDLRQRGMLEETLVLWGGEFGRTPMSQGGNGRDHHIKGFSFMLAGGGIKPGYVHGETDELGYAAVKDPVSVHELHATMLHLLGIDGNRMTVKFQGLDARLVGVEGAVPVRGILA